MKVIKVLEPLGLPPQDLADKLQAAVAGQAEIVFYEERKTDLPTLIERSQDADAVVLSNFPYPREVIEACPRLEYICVAFTGFDHVDMAACAERQIQVANCRGYSSRAVAELVLGFSLAFYRKLIPADKAVRTEGSNAGFLGQELAGKCLGIIGLGDIGQQVAKLAQALGMQVIAYNRSPRQLKDVEMLSLEEVLQRADIVSLHLPSNAQTKKLIDAEKISLMRPEALFINLARGPIVDSEALAHALNQEKIAGAYIDVFETEPPLDPQHPLLQAKNCYLTPHLGFLTEESMYRRADIVAANLRSYLAGKPQNLVS